MGSHLDPTQFPGTPADRHRSPDDNCRVIRTLIGGDVPAFRVSIVTNDPGVEFSVNSALAGLPRIQALGCFSCAREARMAYSQAKPDLTLVDVDGLGTGGIEFIQELKSSNPGVRVIVISALADAESIRQAVGSGCDSYLIKPFSVSQCQASVQWVLERMRGWLFADTMPVRPEGPCARQRMGCCPRLSERERLVQQCLSQGLLYKEIAFQLELSVALVEKLVHRILMRFGARNRTEAGLQWLRCLWCAQRQFARPERGARVLPNAVIAVSPRG